MGEPFDDASFEEQADLGAELLAQGQPELAIDQLEPVVRQPMTRYGVDDEDTLDLLGVLGRALTEARRFAEAESMLTDVVGGRTRVLGADDPQTLVARGNLLRAIGRGGRPHEAIELADALLGDRRRLVGDDHPSTLDTRGHRAQLLDEAGRAADAVDEMRRLLDDRLRLLGPSHPAVISSRHNLAALRSRSASVGPVDALWELEQNAMALEADLGAEHPDTLIGLGMLAEHAQRLGKHVAALVLLDRVIDARSRVLGDDAAPTLTSRRMRCESLRNLGRVDETVASAESLVVDILASLGPGAFETVRARLELAESLRALGDASEPADPTVEARFGEAAERAAASEVSGLEPGHPVRLAVEALRAEAGISD